MKKKCLFFILILISSLAVSSQTNNESVWVGEFTFTDGTSLPLTSAIREDKFAISKENITIFNKTFKGKLIDIHKTPFYLTPKTLTAISKKNRNLAYQIRKRKLNGFGIEQNGKLHGLTGFYAKANEKPLENCMKPENHPCTVEGDAVIIQIKFKDTTENIVLIKSLKFSK
jgi:hypothetical protein